MKNTRIGARWLAESLSIIVAGVIIGDKWGVDIGLAVFLFVYVLWQPNYEK